jgi:hypothetical protein
LLSFGDGQNLRTEGVTYGFNLANGVTLLKQASKVDVVAITPCANAGCAEAAVQLTCATDVFNGHEGFAHLPPPSLMICVVR